MRHIKRKGLVLWPPQAQGNCPYITGSYSFLPHMYLHEQNTQPFLGTNNLHLSSFSVCIISNWYIHWGFHKFSSLCCLIPHNLFCWFSLSTSLSFLYAGSSFKASVLKSFSFYCAHGVKAQIPPLVIVFSAQPQRGGSVYQPLLSSPSSKCSEWNWKWIFLHTGVPTHTNTHPWTCRGVVIPWVAHPRSHGLEFSSHCNIHVMLITGRYNIHINIQNFLRYWAGNPFTCPVEPSSTGVQFPALWHVHGLIPKSSQTSLTLSSNV